jgi:hypothetical protein
MDFTRASAVNSAFRAGKNAGKKEILEELRAWQGHPIDLRDKIIQMLKEIQDGK